MIIIGRIVRIVAAILMVSVWRFAPEDAVASLLRLLLLLSHYMYLLLPLLESQEMFYLFLHV